MARQVLLVGLAGIAAPALATTTLTFEGIGDGATPAGYYAGGTDSQGNAGSDLGVTITGTAVASISSIAGGTGAHTNAPSMATILLATGPIRIHFTRGMGSYVSFVFTYFTLQTGNADDGDPPPPPPPVNIEDGNGQTVPFVPEFVSFYHTRETGYVYLEQKINVPDEAETIYIDAALGLGIDDVRTNVPEPASWAMMIAGFGLTGGVLRRRRSAVVQPACGPEEARQQQSRRA